MATIVGHDRKSALQFHGSVGQHLLLLPQGPLLPRAIRFTIMTTSGVVHSALLQRVAPRPFAANRTCGRLMFSSCRGTSTRYSRVKVWVAARHRCWSSDGFFGRLRGGRYLRRRAPRASSLRDSSLPADLRQEPLQTGVQVDRECGRRLVHQCKRYPCALP